MFEPGKWGNLQFPQQNCTEPESIFSLLKEKVLLTYEAAAKQIFKETNEIGFELLGYDFMIDSNLNSWLIEINSNPCLSTLTHSQDVLIKKLVDDVLRITVDPVFGLKPEEDKEEETIGEYSTLFDLLYVYNTG